MSANSGVMLQPMVPGSTCRLLSWGANSYGQLGIGNKEDQLQPKDAIISNLNIKHITGGGGHTVVITDHGKLLVCGSNNKGELGLNHIEDSITILTPVTSLDQENIIKVAAGWEFTVALNDRGQIFSWGSNTFSQLGRSSKLSYDSSPGLISSLDESIKIIDISAGLRHSLALSENGEVYSWGQGKKGQLEINTPDDIPLKLVSQPTKVDLPERMCKIFCGALHSGALSVTGDLFIWGCNKYGQLTRDIATHIPNSPVVIPNSTFNGTIKDIKSGWTHLLVLTDHGQVYSWGRGDYGQLGRQCYSQHDIRPVLVDYLPNIQKICCGSEHNLALDDDGKLYSWGWNEHGMCGTGDTENVIMPRILQTLSNFKIKHMNCGAGHSLVVIK